MHANKYINGIQLQIMSERTFFAVRYALPGYTSILIALLVAYPKLEGFLTSNTTPIDMTLISAFLAFFTLLSGTAIGFLVSQIWYLVSNWFLHRRALREAIEFLKDKYKLTEDPHHQMVFLDHIVHLAEKEIIAYTQRRFDLKHTLGSTLFATFIGALFGFIVRIDSFRTDTIAFFNIDLLTNIKVPEIVLTTYDCGVILIILILSALLLKSYRDISKEHAMMVNVTVRRIEKLEIFPYSEARAYFPEDYFVNNEN